MVMDVQPKENKLIIGNEEVPSCAYCYQKLELPFYVEPKSKTFFCYNCTHKRSGMELQQPLPHKIQMEEEVIYVLISQIHHKGGDGS